MDIDLILTSDWHLRESIPECRTDDFWKAQWKKVAFVSQLQDTHNCPVLHAGDLYHHWKPSPYLLSSTIAALPAKFYTIYGQHDLPQHNHKESHRSGIHALETAGSLKVLHNAHWGQDPEVEKYPSFQIDYMRDDPDYSVLQRRVLVWHHMVWQGKRLWPGQTDPNSTNVLKKYPEYDLILTGDNHKPFTEEYDGRLLVNPGSLMRQSADQIDFRPRVYLYDARTNTVVPEYLPIEKGAVSRMHLEERTQREDRIDAFISKLEGEWEAGLSFEKNLETFFQNNPTREEVKQIIYKSIEDEGN